MSARRYWILELLGRGGFGSVYRAELQGRAGFRKPVAVKMLNPDRASSPEILRRLRDEARLLACVRHPGIVQVDGLVCLEGRWTVVMEYVPGVSLAELCALGPVPILCAVELAVQVAEALDAAHDARDGERPLHLVHRDIKPSNILLCTDGGAKLLDFGVAQADTDVREARTDELFFGAAEYMAPERWRFQDSPAVDVYSLGVVLYELLVGEHFGRTSPDLAAHGAQVETAIERLGLLNNAGLSTLVAAALAADPDQRPTARQFAKRARALLPDLPGPWLRDWAVREVARARARRPVTADDPLLDRSLAEDDDPDVTAVAPPEPALAFARLRTLVLAVVAILALLAWWAVTAADDLRQADERLVQSARVRVTLPEPVHEPAVPAEPAAAVEAELAAAVAAEPAPPPTAPAAAPAPAPRPPVRSAPAPAAAPAAAARYTANGDAAEVFLVSAAGRFPPGALPAGTYTVEARFPGRGLAEAGRIQVLPGATLSLTCDSGFALCRAD